MNAEACICYRIPLWKALFRNGKSTWYITFYYQGTFKNFFNYFHKIFTFDYTCIESQWQQIGYVWLSWSSLHTPLNCFWFFWTICHNVHGDLIASLNCLWHQTARHQSFLIKKIFWKILLLSLKLLFFSKVIIIVHKNTTNHTF